MGEELSVAVKSFSNNHYVIYVFYVVKALVHIAA